ncbi:MAG: TetR/AcrR family transcriptional regulator [Pseudonocardia sp.]|nr:TetR/AcrR family transcriptional regulator [Pseudonocardia sp.]
MTEENPRRTGRPPLTDSAALLAAARRIGFVDLTVGAVTAAVGVKYSTFYRHFPSVESLLSALVDQVLDETPFPEPGPPWQEHLARTSATMFDLLRSHPGLAQALARLPERPDRLVEIWAGTTDVLLAAGFSGKDAVLGATGAFELAIQPWIDSPGTGAGGAVRREQARALRHPIDDRIREAMAAAVDDPPAGWIRDKVDLLIQGLATRLPAPGADPTTV